MAITPLMASPTNLKLTKERKTMRCMVSFNKTFHLIKQETSKNKTMIKLTYDQNALSNGFPYALKILLKYTITWNLQLNH